MSKLDFAFQDTLFCTIEKSKTSTNIIPGVKVQYETITTSPIDVAHVCFFSLPKFAPHIHVSKVSGCSNSSFDVCSHLGKALKIVTNHKAYQNKTDVPQDGLAISHYPSLGIMMSSTKERQYWRTIITDPRGSQNCYHVVRYSQNMPETVLQLHTSVIRRSGGCSVFVLSPGNGTVTRVSYESSNVLMQKVCQMPLWYMHSGERIKSLCPNATKEETDSDFIMYYNTSATVNAKLILKIQFKQPNFCKTGQHNKYSGRIMLKETKSLTACKWNIILSSNQYIKFNLSKIQFKLFQSDEKTCECPASNVSITFKAVDEKSISYKFCGRETPQQLVMFSSVEILLSSNTIPGFTKETETDFQLGLIRYNKISLHKVNCSSYHRKIIAGDFVKKQFIGPVSCHWMVLSYDLLSVIQIQVSINIILPSWKVHIHDHGRNDSFAVIHQNKSSITVVTRGPVAQITTSWNFNGKVTLEIKTTSLKGSGCGGPQSISGETGTITCINPPLLQLGLGRCKPASLKWRLHSEADTLIKIHLVSLTVENEKFRLYCHEKGNKIMLEIFNKYYKSYQSCGYGYPKTLLFYEETHITLEAIVNHIDELDPEYWKLKLVIDYQLINSGQIAGKYDLINI